MSEPDMIERVARAAYYASPHNKKFEQLSAFRRLAALREARAVIETFDKPTEAMFRACWSVYHPWGKNAPPIEGYGYERSYEEMKVMLTGYLTAMTAAALSPTPPDEQKEKE